MLEAGGWARGPATRWSWLVGEGGVLLNCCSFRVLMQSMLGTNTTNVRKVFIFLLRNSQFLESLKKNRLNNCVIKIIMPYYRPTN